MAHIDRVYEDAKIAHVKEGSVLLVTGWVFLCMAAMGGIYVFEAIRHGSYMWLGLEIPMAVIGLLLISVGTHRRSRFS